MNSGYAYFECQQRTFKMLIFTFSRICDQIIVLGRINIKMNSKTDALSFSKKILTLGHSIKLFSCIKSEFFILFTVNIVNTASKIMCVFLKRLNMRMWFHVH